MSAGVKTVIIAFSFGMIIVSFIIGWVSKKKVNTTQAFFGGTGMFGPFTVGLSSTAAVASAFALVGVPGLMYTTGNPMTFWMLSSAAFAMAYIILGKKVRAMAELGPIASLGDISDLRFNNNRVIKAFQGFVMVLAGLIVIIAFFGITGGFGEVLKTAAAAGEVSGEGVTKSLGPDFFNAWGVLPGTVAMAWMLIPILGTVGQPQVLTRMYALKDPRDMPKLGLTAGISHMIVGFFAIVVAYGAIFLVASGKVAPLAKGDSAIFIFADYVGLYAQIFIYAAILAAAMSSASMFLSISANIISRDLPSALGKKIASEKQITVSRITMLILGVIAILFSLTSGDMVAILGTFGWGTLMSGTFPPFIIGLLWEKATGKGVAAGLVVGLALNLFSLTGFKWPGALPWYFNVIMISIVLTVIVSLFTKEKVAPRIKAVIEL